MGKSKTLSKHNRSPSRSKDRKPKTMTDEISEKDKKSSHHRSDSRSQSNKIKKRKHSTSPERSNQKKNKNDSYNDSKQSKLDEIQGKAKKDELVKDKNNKPRSSRFSDNPTPDKQQELTLKRKAEDALKKKQLEDEQTKLVAEVQEEMRKRRERVLAWRGQIKNDESSDGDNKNVIQKYWTLDDDADEEGENEEEENENEDSAVVEPTNEGNEEKIEEVDPNVDPLDAFMKGLRKEILVDNVEVSKSSEQSISGHNIQSTVLQTTVKSSNIIGQKIKPDLIDEGGDEMGYGSDHEIEESIILTSSKKSVKTIAAPNHDTISYKPFRKNFYIEVPDLVKMTPEEVNTYRLELENIQVHGKNIPKPFKKWAQIGVSVKILDTLKRHGYEKPTPIQAQAIPSIMSGRDVIGIAKTGSGKTLAFLLPMFRHVLDQPALNDGEGPIAIIMTPTRELATQIYRECRKFTINLGITCACIYGGSVISEQIGELKKGAEVVVCTPGRMIDMLAANNGKVTNCRRCTYLVLDEADRMFDMGFEPQVTKIIEQVRPDRQSVMFSATFSRSMEGVARKILIKPIEIQVGGRNVVCSDITQHAIVLDEDNKFFKLLELLGRYQRDGSVLVFVEKQDSTDELLKDLLKKGYPCLSLHGGMDQYDRDSTINDFKNGVAKLLIATSVAARGLDIRDIVLVVNYDCPNHYEDYVHRVGRTGRAGNKGTAITFLTEDDSRHAGDIIMAFEQSEIEPPLEITLLWQSYIDRLVTEGKPIPKFTGFSGKGFKFDNSERNVDGEKRKNQKWSLGLQDSGDEAEEEEKALNKIEEEIERAFGSGPRRTFGIHVAVDKDKVELAQSIASKLSDKIIQNTAPSSMSVAQKITSSILKGENVVIPSSFGRNEPTAKDDLQGTPAADCFFEEIEINDFPQQARWKITSKETLQTISDLSECGITVRGQYYSNDRAPPAGERRLYLLIEGTTEMKVHVAKGEIKRLLKEECIKNDLTFSRTGKYKVL